MTIPTIVDSKSQTQVLQVWDKPTSLAQIGDYIRVPFTPVMQVADRDMLESGQVWLLLKPSTGSYTEEWVLEPEQAATTQQQPEPQPQPVSEAKDALSCQLQPTQEAQAEFEQGYIHGQHDGVARLHPIYTHASCQYSRGYIEGYNITNAPQQHEAVKQAEWSVIYDPKWKWYQAWVGSRCIGKGASYQEAERLAQRYIATDLMLKRQNAAVMAAVAG